MNVPASPFQSCTNPETPLVAADSPSTVTTLVTRGADMAVRDRQWSRDAHG
ncbi:MAG: hypothetical protein GY711_04035 [bacterium]|nr:hypothetical protein [bacterium]